MNRFLLSLLFIVACNCFILGQTDLYKESKDYFKEHRYNDALSSINKAIERDSLNSKFFLQKTNILYVKKQYSKALVALNKVNNLHGETEESVLYRSILLDSLGEKEESLASLIVYNDYNPSKLVSQQLATTFFSLKMYDESIEYYKKILDLSSDDFEARIDLSNILYALDRKEEAIKNIQEGIRLHNNLELRLYLLHYYEEEEEYLKCLDVIDKLIDIDEGKLEFIELRAKIYEKLGNLKKAHKDYLFLLNKSLCNMEYYSRIIQYQYDNRVYEKAIENSLNVIKCNPDSEQAFIETLYTSYFFQKDFEKGKIFLNKYLSANPKNSNANYIKALILVKEENLDQSLKILDIAKSTDENNENETYITVLKSFISLIKRDYSTFLNLLAETKLDITQDLGKIVSISKNKEEKSNIDVVFNANSGEINISLSISQHDYSILKKDYNISW
ncbi:MAG: hypothetical protein GY755_08780 [Chloroflexi bacterium]|nr:hypothetical protein [Chloroflexota bacterium]